MYYLSCVRQFKRAFISLALLLLLLPHDSNATWRKIGQFPQAQPFVVPTVNSCFFFDPQHGLVGIDGFSGIMRTTDGGLTWNNSVFPKGFIGFVTDIYMTDSLNGWAVIEDDTIAHGLWRTQDAGATWVVDPNVVGAYSSVVALPTSLIVTSRATFPSLGRSTDGGVSFQALALDLYNDVAFTDNLHGVASAFTNVVPPRNYAPSLWTDDAGFSWHQNNVFIEAWSVYAQKGTPNFFIAGEKVQSDPTDYENVFRSTDYGQTWVTAGTIKGRTTGHIAGSGGVIYVQAWTQLESFTKIKGILRSTDRGTTWQQVGGPSNYRDTRFWVGGCLGQTIIAFDEDGGVWRSDDGGDGTITASPHNPLVTPGVLSLSADLCSTIKGQTIITNLTCDSLIVDSVFFADSSDAAISSGALTISKSPGVPFILSPTYPDTFAFYWQPGMIGAPKAPTTFLLRVHSHLPDMSESFDTTIAVTVSSSGTKASLSFSTTSIALDTINICNRTIDSLFSFTNHGCDTVFLTKISLAGSNDWQFARGNGSSITLPIAVPQDSSIDIRTIFSPSVTGAQQVTVTLRFISEGVTFDTSVTVSGGAFRTLSVTADQTIHFPTASICIAEDTIVSFRNNTCDTMTVDSIAANFSGVFQFTKPVTLPILVPPGGGFVLPVRYSPLKNVSSAGNITYSYHIQSDSGTVSTVLTGVGTNGNSIFTTDPPNITQLSFPTIDRCSDPDSLSFVISNTGCDTMDVVAASLLNVPDTVLSLSVSKHFPLRLAPGDADSLMVTFIPSAAGTYNGVILIPMHDAAGDLFIDTIKVNSTVLAGAKLATLGRSAVDLGTLPPCSSRFDTIVLTNTGCANVSVSGLSFDSADYTFLNSPSLPFTLVKGSSDTLIVLFSPSDSGSRPSVATITTDDQNAPIKSVSYQAIVNPIDHISFRLSQVDPNILVSDTAQIDIIPNRDWAGKKLQEISFAVTYNSDLLTYVRTLSYDPGISPIVATSVLPNTLGQLNVQITSPTEIPLKKDAPLLRFFFATALTDTIRTPLNLSLLELNAGDSVYSHCVLNSSSVDGSFSLNFACGGLTLLDYMSEKVILIAKQAHPDPASANAIVTFPFTLLDHGNVSLDITDVTGKNVSHSELAEATEGEHQFTVSTSDLPSGAYSYTIEYQGSSSGIVRGRFVVLK